MGQLHTFFSYLMGLDADSLEESRRRRLFLIFVMMILLPLVILGIRQLSHGSFDYGLIDLIAAAVLTGFIIALRFLKDGKPVYRLSIVILVTLLIYWISTGAVQGYASLWALAFPPYAFFLIGKREGLFWTFLLGITVAFLFVNPYRVFPVYQYPSQYVVRHLFAFIVISVLTYNYESVRVRYLAAIRAEGEKLVREKERIEEAKGKVDEVNLLLEEQIEERKRAERELRRHRDHLEELVATRTLEIEEKSRKLEDRERLFRLLADNINDLIWSTDLELRPTFFSPSIKNMYGYSAEEAMEIPVHEFNAPESVEKLMAAYRREMALEKSGKGDPERHTILELKQVKKDGTVFDVELTTSFIRDDGGRAIGLVGVTRDITQRKKAALDKERMQEQLAQMQKMEALGTLVGGIAHDFNNILAGIMGYTELALNNIEEGSTKKMLERVMKAGDRATDLVNQILSFSRNQKGEAKPVSPAEITTEVLKLMRATLPSTIEIEDAIDSESYIQADPTNIHQVLMNLCTNAAHAMKQRGGVLTITLQDVTLDEDDVPRGATAIPGQYLRISVEDTGIGMTPDIRKKAFDPFFTTKGLGEGTGMGLATVHGIITKLSGFVSLSSEPNRGTAIHVFIPVIGKPAQVERGAADKPLKGGTERILFVDDEEVIVDLAKDALAGYGYQITAFQDSTLALTHFREHPDRFDLVVTDMTMPKMTGDALTKEIRAKRPDIPVIMCTGFSETIDEQQAKRLHIDAFLYKPIIITKLLKTIRKILGQKAHKGKSPSIEPARDKDSN